MLERKGKNLIMKEAAKIVFERDNIKIYGILGNLKEVDDCEIDVIDLMKHEIVLKKKE
jgi:predicted RNA-binding protein